MSWEVQRGDCLELMRELEDCSVDAVVTDPPYGIGFMGKEWDGAAIHEAAARDSQTRRDLGPHSAARPGRAAPRASSAFGNAAHYAGPVSAGRPFQDFSEQWAREAFRVLKPGGHLVAFAGTRTYHRMVCGVEDAGFEIRDQLAWLFGSGFPKSRNLGDGWGSALKPAHEPIVLARKPFTGTVAGNVLEHGTGAINVDGCRIGTDDTRSGGNRQPARNWAGGELENVEPTGSEAGRWPANVVLSHAEECGQEGCHPGCPVRLLDEQTGTLQSGRLLGHHRRGGGSQIGTFEIRDRTGEPCDFGGDSGGASRFFYCAKTSSAERNAGLASFEKRTADPYGEHRGRRMEDKSRIGGKPARRAENFHPTVKPVELMRWLCRLITPLGGLILDPFAGSGSTGCAAVLEGFDFTGIEREAEYVELARARITHWAAQPVQLGLEGA